LKFLPLIGVGDTGEVVEGNIDDDITSDIRDFEATIVENENKVARTVEVCNKVASKLLKLRNEDFVPALLE
jgi:hypothetical protein